MSIAPPSSHALSHLELVEAAILAPSPDNNQPWRFASQADRLLVYLAMEKRLPSDVNAMSDLTGLGAAIENIGIAASEVGYSAKVEYLAPPTIATVEDAREPLARISLSPGGGPDPLFAQLEARCTCRKLYSSRPVEADCLARLSEAAKGVPDVQVDWITDRRRIRSFARLISTTDLIRFQSETFHNEIFRQLRFTPEEAERTREGMDVRTLELPPGTVLLLRLLRPWNRMRWLHRLGLGRLLTVPSVVSVLKSGAIGVLSVPEPTANAFLRGGQAFQRIWLAATAEELSLQPLGSPGVFFAHIEQLAGRKLTDRQQRILHQARARFGQIVPDIEARTVQIAFRVGHCRAPRFRSLRLRAEETLISEG